MKVKALVTAALATSALVATTSPLSAGVAAPSPAQQTVVGASSLDPERLALRRMAPRGFRIGTAVAGGGHHVDQPYPIRSHTTGSTVVSWQGSSAPFHQRIR
jgi:endo-1,4-beta-xylanase